MLCSFEIIYIIALKNYSSNHIYVDRGFVQNLSYQAETIIHLQMLSKQDIAQINCESIAINNL